MIGHYAGNECLFSVLHRKQHATEALLIPELSGKSLDWHLWSSLKLLGKRECTWSLKRLAFAFLHLGVSGICNPVSAHVLLARLVHGPVPDAEIHVLLLK